MLAQVGNMVEINGTLIPAVNIQVEEPGMRVHMDGSESWYGIYFEVMFEDGGLWIVDQGSYEGDLETIFVEEFDRWGQDQDLDTPSGRTWFYKDNWEAFLEYYQTKAKRRAA